MECQQQGLFWFLLFGVCNLSESAQLSTGTAASRFYLKGRQSRASQIRWRFWVRNETKGMAKNEPKKKTNRPIFAEMGKKTSHFVYEIWLDNTTQNTRKWRVKKRSLTKKQKEMINWVVVSNIFYLHPETWGRWTHFDEIFFKGVGSTTNQWFLFDRHAIAGVHPRNTFF